MIAVGTTAVGFYSRGERLGSSLNTTRKSRNFIAEEWAEVGISG